MPGGGYGPDAFVYLWYVVSDLGSWFACLWRLDVASKFYFWIFWQKFSFSWVLSFASREIGFVRRNMELVRRVHCATRKRLFV